MERKREMQPKRKLLYYDKRNINPPDSAKKICKSTIEAGPSHPDKSWQNYMDGFEEVINQLPYHRPELNSPSSSGNHQTQDINWYSSESEEDIVIPLESTHGGKIKSTSHSKSHLGAKNRSRKKSHSTQYVTEFPNNIEYQEKDYSQPSIEDVESPQSSQKLEAHTQSHQTHSRHSNLDADISEEEDEENRLISQEICPGNMLLTDNQSLLPMSQDISQESSVDSTCNVNIPVSEAEHTKPSEWLKKLKSFSTPNKQFLDEDNDGLDTSNIDDSSKKKTKYINDGFAARLHRLINRERSARTVWSHKQSFTKAETSVTITVCIEKAIVDIGLVRTECRVEFVQGSLHNKIVQGEPIQVIFTESHAIKNSITPGTIVCIYPPWQMLQQPSGHLVLMCPYFSRVIKLGQSTTCNDEDNTNDEQSCRQVCIATWNCPCSSDSAIVPSDCIADTRNSMMKDAMKIHVTNPTATFPITPAATAQLCTIRNICPPSHEEGKTIHSMLDSIERAGLSQVQYSNRVNITATIQRVFCKKLHKSQMKRYRDSSQSQSLNDLQWSLLLQDDCGFISELILPPDACDSREWSPIIKSHIGHMCSFHEVTIAQRTVHAKSSRLFSMVHAVWRAEAVTLLSDSQSQSSVEVEKHPPGFIYMLRAESSVTKCVAYSDVASSVYTQPKMVPLSSLAISCESYSRVSCQGIIVYHQNITITDSQCAKKVYLADESLQGVYIIVNVSRMFGDTIPNATQISVTFTDLLSHNAELWADEYSRIQIPENDTSSRPCNISFPAILVSTGMGNLVTVSGAITDMDKTGSCIWSVCDRCASDNIQMCHSDSSRPFCQSCQNFVSPVSKMKMDVFMKDNELGEATLKIKLLQTTIESLLPDECVEGYDVQCVLQKVLGPLNCIVTATDFTSDHCLKYVELQEIG